MEKNLKVSLRYQFPTENYKLSVFLVLQMTTRSGRLHGLISVYNYGALVWRGKPGQNWWTQNSKNKGRMLYYTIIVETIMGL